MLAIIGKILAYLSEFFALFTGIFFLLTFIENKDDIDKLPEIREYPTVAIIIPAYNEEENIASTIGSAASLDYPKDKLKIFVVDDGSKDKTLENAKLETAKHPESQIQVIANPHGGKARAMNTVLRIIDAEFVATLDADSTVAPSSLRNMIPYFSKNDRVAAVVSAMKIKNPKTFLQKIQSTEYLICFYLKKMASFVNGLLVTPGPLSVYRMSVFGEIGGFDEANLTEDGEMALRLQKHQYRIEYCHKAEVFTSAPATIRSLKNQRVRWNRGTVRNFIKYRELFANPKYGDFGLFIFPSLIVSLILSLDLVLIILIRFIFIFLKRWEYGILIRLPKITWSDGLHFDMFFVQPTAAQIIAFIIFFISLISFYFIYHFSSSKDFKTAILFYVPYIFLYYPIFVIGLWLITIFYELTNKKLSWYK